METLEPFASKDGEYVYEGCNYQSAEELIQCGMLGFCGCGIPDENLRYVLGGLELINETPQGGRDFSAWLADNKRRALDHFGGERARYFFYYWADKEELAEHGGSVPGWLTEKGERLLYALRAWDRLDSSAHDPKE